MPSIHSPQPHPPLPQLPQLPQLLALRHDLHAHPELSYQEKRTSDVIAAYLQALGLEPHRGIGKTGIVASVHGEGYSAENPGRSIGLRSDMDALPLKEITGLAYASRYPGKMHACGHDGHVAMLLGAAHLLSEKRDFDGTVHLIFQPAEEGGAGAKAMMDDGLFERFPCQAVFALHNWPELEQGQMAVRPGAIMAANIRFEIRVRGRGGHAALPHTTLDPIPVACALVTQLQTLVSRSLDPLDSAVLTIGKISAGTTENIIPNEAVIYGTLRTLQSSTEKEMIEGIKRIAHHIAAAHQCQAMYIHKPGYPNTCNSVPEAELMAQVMREVVGEENTHYPVPAAMTSEDFGFMLEQVPGAYGWIGNAGNSSGVEKAACLHHPRYDFNDDNIALGALFWRLLVQRWFERK